MWPLWVCLPLPELLFYSCVTLLYRMPLLFVTVLPYHSIY